MGKKIFCVEFQSYDFYEILTFLEILENIHIFMCPQGNINIGNLRIYQVEVKLSG